MAKIDMMWLNDGIHGRADKTSRTYTKVDRLTGRRGCDPREAQWPLSTCFWSSASRPRRKRIGL